MIAFDTETGLIRPGCLAPTVICASFCDGSAPVVFGQGDSELRDFTAYLLEEEEFVGHRVSYDLIVSCVSWPELWPLMWRALRDGRVHDTLIREKLRLLGTTGDLEFLGGKKLEYSLAALARRLVGLDLFEGKEGEDIWRTRYQELAGLSAKDYPQEAYDYAALDAQATYEIWKHQQEKGAQFFQPEGLHVMADVCLRLITTSGLGVDRETKERLQREVEEQLTPEALPLVFEAGIVIPAQPPRPYARAKEHDVGCPKKNCDCPPKMTKPKPEKVAKKDALIPLIEEVCRENDLEIKLTAKGNVAADAEWLEEIAPLSPVLAQFAERQKLIKLVTSYFPGMEWPFGSGETAGVIHPQYDPLKKTGRVSSYGVTKKSKNPLFPSVNIQQADPRLRQIYVPKPINGKPSVFAVADYTAIDLCCLAQTIYSLFGHSTLRDQINKGLDPHSFLGAVLAYDGDPGFAREVDRLELTEDDDLVYKFFRSKEETNPDWFKHWRTFAKPVGLGFPGGMGLNTMVAVCAGYGLKIDRVHARRLKKIWLRAYPEMRRYLDSWVPGQDGTYVSPRGMVRAGCSYTELANGKALQTPAAEGMKIAMSLVTQSCYDPSLDDILYGCRPVVNMHDELVLEIPRDDLMHERACRMSELMEAGMAQILPDVKVRAEPVLTERWVKEAKPVYDENGRLTVWKTPSSNV